MVDLVRPEPRPSWRDRSWRDSGLPRLLTVAGAVLLLAVTAWWLLRSPAPPVERSLPMAGKGTTSTGSAGSTVAGSGSAVPGSASGVPGASAVPTTAAAELVVQAAGAVVTPGVYRVPAGARVVDVVTAAGGPAAGANLQGVPLASKVADGQRVYVPAQGEAVPATAAPTEPTAEAPLDLNGATAEQLDQLPGVGPATAQAIVEYRTRHGPLSSVDELLDVPGIGTAKLEAFRELVRV